MASQKTTEPVVVSDADTGPELLASSIVALAEATRKLLNGRLNKRALLVLLKDSSGVSIRDIDLVLQHAASLDRYVVKKR